MDFKIADLYPDVAAAGGLARALDIELKKLGDIGATFPPRPKGEGELLVRPHLLRTG